MISSAVPDTSRVIKEFGQPIALRRLARWQHSPLRPHTKTSLQTNANAHYDSATRQRQHDVASPTTNGNGHGPSTARTTTTHPLSSHRPHQEAGPPQRPQATPNESGRTKTWHGRIRGDVQLRCSEDKECQWHTSSKGGEHQKIRQRRRRRDANGE